MQMVASGVSPSHSGSASHSATSGSAQERHQMKSSPEIRPVGRPPHQAPPTSAKPAQSRLRLILMLGALTAFAPLSIDMYLPALPALSVYYGTGASEVQLTLSSFFFGLALGQAMIGPLSDALGRRQPLLVGLAVYALASLLCATAPTISALVAFRFIQGFAGAA